MSKERNFTNVTTVATGDFVRIVTSAGASVKGSLVNFAKSLLTTTFSGLSLGGSEQSVKSALDSLNSKIVQLTWGTTITFNCPLNHRFLMIAGSNTVYSGVNYSDAVTFSSIVTGSGNITYTATKSGNTVTVNASANTNISILVF